MGNLDPIVRTINNILTRYGGTCIVTINIDDGEYDYATSTAVISKTDYTVQMIAFDYIQRMQGIGSETNTLIRSGDKQLFIKQTAGMPLPNPATDSVIYNGTRFNIITVKDVNPSGASSFVLEVFVRE